MRGDLPRKGQVPFSSALGVGIGLAVEVCGQGGTGPLALGTGVSHESGSRAVRGKMTHQGT